jgi:hypothetical protein
MEGKQRGGGEQSLLRGSAGRGNGRATGRLGDWATVKRRRKAGGGCGEDWLETREGRAHGRDSSSDADIVPRGDACVWACAMRRRAVRTTLNPADSPLEELAHRQLYVMLYNGQCGDYTERRELLCERERGGGGGRGRGRGRGRGARHARHARHAYGCLRR